MTPYDIILTGLQALIGGLLVMWLRNDRVETTGKFRWTRSIWVGLTGMFVALLIGLDLFTRMSPTIAWVSGIMALVLFGFVLTAPHGQTLRGPHQDIPPDEDDPIFETAMFITGHQGGGGDKLGWPTWLVYQGLRYVLPMAMLGTLLGNLWIAFSGVLVAACYWPIGHLVYRRLNTQPQFFGAFMCGAIIIGGL